jgi:localization factor PodJL
MRQTLSSRMPDYDASTPSGRFGATGAETHDSYESFMAAAAASERRAVETAAKTALALDSVAAWIEQAQSRLAHVGDSSPVAEALKRIEERLDAQRSAEPDGYSAGPGIQDALRGFETRIAGLTERLATSQRPAARRSVKPETNLTSAVAEIRRRQDELDHPSSRDEARGAASMPDRSHASIMLSLRGDIAKLAGQLDTVRAPDPTAIEQLTQEFEQLRGSVGSLATRDDLAHVERSLSELSGHIEDARVVRGGIAQVNAKLESVQGAMQRLSERQAAPDSSRLEQTVRSLADKLDAMGARGADPVVQDAMAAQLWEIRGMVAGLAAPADIAALGQTVSELRNEVGAIALRQVDVGDFASLRASVDDVRRVLSSAGPGFAPVSARDDIADGMRPVEALLHALVDKLDGVERQVAQRNAADPDAMDALERQIADLAARFSQNTGRDPAISHLENAMSGLMGEIATWRDDAFAAAERAARNAVSEALAGNVAPGATRHVLEREVDELKQRWDASEKRTEDSLAAVNRTLEGVAARIGSLSLDAAPGKRRIKTDAEPVAIAEPIIRHVEAGRLEASGDALMAEAERPIAADEILLEPGAARPKAAGRPAVELGEGADIKSSFIAAARRAAQAAATDAAASKARGGAQRLADPVKSDEPSGLAKRLRAMVDKHRRPLLLSAAALVLALGALQILGRGNVPASLTNSAKVAAPAARPADFDPVTTQSIAPRSETRAPAPAPATPNLAILPPPAAPTPQAAAPMAATPMAAAPMAPPATASQAAPAAPPAAAPAANAALDAKPTPSSEALPAGLKQAALGGHPVAAYDYAARAVEGRGMPKDPQLAVRFFEKAAEKGFAPAQYRLGNLYEKGLGVARDLEQAKTWYRRAAEGGNARAMHNLAVLLADGGGAKPDYAAAVTWFSKAAEFGVRDSQFNLAVLYARGLGTAQDLQKSYMWFAITAAGGDADSAKKRDDVGSRLSPADLTRARASAERWKATTPNPAANDVVVPASGWAELPTSTAASLALKKLARDGRV